MVLIGATLVVYVQQNIQPLMHQQTALQILYLGNLYSKWDPFGLMPLGRTQSTLGSQERQQILKHQTKACDPYRALTRTILLKQSVIDII